MKKQIASIALASALIFSGVSQVFAETPGTQTTVESNTDTQVSTDSTTTPTQSTTTDSTTVNTTDTTLQVDAGLTPEDFTYFLDKLFENIQLTFTFDPEAKAQIYAEISAERLAELKALNPETQSKFVNELLASYEEALTKAGEQVEEAKAEGTEIAEETTNVMDQVATEGEATVDEVADQLEDEQKEALEETITNVKITAAVVRDIDPKVVQSLRDQGIGYGKIALTVSISNLSGKSVEEVTELLKKNGIGKVAKELGIHPGKLKNAKLTISIENNEDKSTTDSNEEANVENQTRETVQTQDDNQDNQEQSVTQAISAKTPVKEKVVNHIKREVQTEVKEKAQENAEVKVEENKNEKKNDKKEEVKEKIEEKVKEKKEKREHDDEENEVDQSL
ncbi:DUF5667 domain-containing protein [Tepidibacillus fermentans]|uniref:DUF5667 domain-containing protein n=1 Tax=Tepidibacillus fermentans TaxID=1281767 RepID=A0A4R3K6K9_9BACI|nr:DUF5667 domain-containing protein [Tepidibacillus fermentans]TCS78459.1 hypothetical protein EDD72_1273 [Tepidibacillus fermentans]